jgi:cold shock CspA family protein
MFKKSLYFIVALFTVFSMLMSAAPVSASGLAATRQARGRVIAINKRTRVVTIRNTSGARIALKYNSNTKLTIRGKSVSIARMHVGDRIIMSYTPKAGAIKGTATNGEDTPGAFELEGFVSAVDTVAGTVDIASRYGGSIVKLKVDTATVITREDLPATLADLAFGDRIEARYNSSTMLASSLKVESDIDQDEVEGLVAAFDAAAGTITITPENGGADVVINTSSATVFMYEDSPGSFSNLQVGQDIEAKVDPLTMLASYVEFETEDDWK